MTLSLGAAQGFNGPAPLGLFADRSMMTKTLEASARRIEVRRAKAPFALTRVLASMKINETLSRSQAPCADLYVPSFYRAA